MAEWTRRRPLKMTRGSPETATSELLSKDSGASHECSNPACRKNAPWERARSRQRSRTQRCIPATWHMHRSENLACRWARMRACRQWSGGATSATVTTTVVRRRRTTRSATIDHIKGDASEEKPEQRHGDVEIDPWNLDKTPGKKMVSQHYHGFVRGAQPRQRVCRGGQIEDVGSH